MRIEQRVAPGVVILDLYDRFVMEDGVDAFKDKINTLIRQGHRRILLNFERVTFLDSAAVGAIAWKYTTAKKQDGDIKLLHLQPRSFKVLETTKLLTVIQTFDSEAEAIESFFSGDHPDDDVDPIFT
jgi:anti-anti-sigma factor